MTKLIEADSIIGFARDELLCPTPYLTEEEDYGYKEAMRRVMEYVKEDYDIIRCHECDFSTKTAVCWCRKMEKVVKPDWFCADAEYGGDYATD